MKIGRRLTLVSALVCAGTVVAQQPTAAVNTAGLPVIVNGEKTNYNQHELSVIPELAVPAASEQQSVPLPPTMVSTNSAGMTKLLDVFPLGDGIGIGGILTGDFNADGTMDVVLGNPAKIVFASYANGGLTLDERIDFSDSLGKLRYFRDSITDGHYAIFYSNNVLYKLDLITHKVVASVSSVAVQSYLLVPSSATTSVLLVRNNLNQLQVFDPATLSLLATHSGFTADLLQVGAFTKKNSQQVLFADGKIYNLANHSLIEEKTLSIKPERLTQVIDRDGDGLDELAWSGGWTNVVVYSPASDEIISSVSPGINVDALTVADINKDGKNEVVYGDGQWGKLHAVNPNNGQELWQLNNPEHGTSSIAFADLDKDGSLDVMWGSGYSSSGPDYLYIHDVLSKAKKWQSEDITGPFNFNALADVDQDGDLDALVLSARSNSGYNGGMLQVFDIQSKKRLYSVTAANNWGRHVLVAAGDVDGDNKTDIVIGASDIYDQAVRVLDGKTGVEKLSIKLGSGDDTSALELVDLNRDSVAEIIVGNNAEHTGSAGAALRVIDGKTGTVLKTSALLPMSWSGMQDITVLPSSDNSRIYTLYNNALYQYNYSLNTLKKLNTVANLSNLTKVVVAGNEVLAVSAGSNLLLLDDTGATTASMTPCQNQTVVSLAPAQVGSVAVNCGTRTVLFNLTSFEVTQSIATLDNSANAVFSQFAGNNYLLLGGNVVAVYHDKPTVQLPNPDAQKYTTHVLKPVTGQFKIAADVDYFLVKNALQFGRLTFTDRAKGLFTYQPNGKLGKETVQVYAAKTGVVSNVTEISIDLTNSAPVAVASEASTHWRKPVQLTLQAKDDDGEILTFAIAAQPAHGVVKLVDANSGLVEYTPSGNSIDSVSFGFNTKDSLATSDVKQVTIKLTNTKPVATDLTYTSSWQTPVNGLLKGDDADGDVVSYELASQPSQGSVQLDNKTGLFVYQTTQDADQTVTFSYVVKDKFATSDAKTVTVTVKGSPKSDSGGAMGGIGLLALLTVAATRRRRR